MTKERVYLLDTTLRDGAQTTGVSFTAEQKRQVADILADFGMDFVEGGYPGANAVDTDFFMDVQAKPFGAGVFTAFGMTSAQGANDPALAKLIHSGAAAISLVAKSSEYQVKTALGKTLEYNLEMIGTSVRACKAAGKTVLIDLEHAFDGYRENPEYALACAKAALDAGADWLVLCDTNGGTMPETAAYQVSEYKKRFPNAQLGIHAHNDTEQAVAVSLAAVRAGARMVQGTVNGLGERCGNANLCSIIPNLLKPEFADRFETGIMPEKLAHLSRLAETVAEIAGVELSAHAPYVGASAFATKAGIHASAVLKDPKTYEHVPPESVGNRRRILGGQQSGLSNIRAQLAEQGFDPDAMGKDELTRISDKVRALESKGYSFEDAGGSFCELVDELRGDIPPFSVTKVHLQTAFTQAAALYGDAPEQMESVATLQMTIGDAPKVVGAVSENGPVSALCSALHQGLRDHFGAAVDGIRLRNFSTTLLDRDRGAEATPRVRTVFECAGQTFATVGYSTNIQNAAAVAISAGYRQGLKRLAIGK